MPWTPPSVPPNTRADNTPLTTNHPGDHNDISDALTAIINVLGSNPEGAEASITALVAAIDARIDALEAVEFVTSGTNVVVTDANSDVVVPFGVTFTGTPIVVAINGDRGAGNFFCQMNGSTATTFVIHTGLSSGVSVRINWIARGVLA